jgi:hypothetical protein
VCLLYLREMALAAKHGGELCSLLSMKCRKYCGPSGRKAENRFSSNFSFSSPNMDGCSGFAQKLMAMTPGRNREEHPPQTPGSSGAASVCINIQGNTRQTPTEQASETWGRAATRTKQTSRERKQFWRWQLCQKRIHLRITKNYYQCAGIAQSV